jgi:2',3'-cyclic-nucleotide 2'-phosphodiesterase/3'-nucleotidase
MRKALPLVLLLPSLLPGELVKVQVLATTDMHGYVMPYDYQTGKPAERGLAKIAALITSERKRNPNTVLIDVGDTIQGSALTTVYEAQFRGKNRAGLVVNPMSAAMNAVGYDAMVLGNHEFNYGLAALNHAREGSRFPWLSANTRSDGSVKPFASYIVKSAGGVKIAVVGVTTPGIPAWEKPEHYAGYSWTSGVEAARAAVSELRAKHQPDIIVAAVHAGLERNPSGSSRPPEAIPGENMVYAVASEVDGIDAVVFGHTHAEVPSLYIGNTVVVQPKNWGISLAKIEFTLEREGSGRWRIAGKQTSVLPASAAAAPDPEVLRIAAPYHEAAEAWLNTPVTQAAVPLDASRSRVEDAAIIDAIQQVQLHYSKADVSFTAPFNPRVRVASGPVTVRQIAALYVYDNELFAIEGNGKMVREALENAALYFNTCSTEACTGSLINRGVFGFNFDVAQGVTYEIDLMQPPGRRIRNLNFRGEPLADDRPLRIAINNYRAGGSGGYTMFRNPKIVWRSYEDIRELIIRYYGEGRPLPAEPDRNWRIIPDSAHAALIDQSRQASQRSQLQ